MAHMAPRTFAINPGTLAIPVLPSKILPRVRQDYLFAYSIGEKREGVFLCLH